MKDFVGRVSRPGAAAVQPSHSPLGSADARSGSPPRGAPALRWSWKAVGLLTVGNIGELVALQAAGRQPGALAAEAGETGR